MIRKTLTILSLIGLLLSVGVRDEISSSLVTENVSCEERCLYWLSSLV